MLSALSLLPPILYNHAAQGLCPDAGKEGLGPDVQTEIHSAKLNLNFREITDHFYTRMPHAVLGTHLYYTIIWFCLESKSTWESCILSGNQNSGLKNNTIWVTFPNTTPACLHEKSRPDLGLSDSKAQSFLLSSLFSSKKEINQYKSEIWVEKKPGPQRALLV